MVAPVDLQLPVGELNPDWYADLTILLQTSIDEGVTRGDTDEAVTAFAYYRAYSAIHHNLMSQPATQRDRNKSDTYHMEQLAWWEARARFWRCKYEDATGVSRPLEYHPGAVR